MKKKLIMFFLLLFSLQTMFSTSSNEVLASIKALLGELKDSSSGAIDSEGNYTKDSGNGLNCSGFAKWIVDGFYYPLTEGLSERYMSLKLLREKHPEERGPKEILMYEDTRDPYFGLDFTRNMAVQLGKKRGENTFYKKCIFVFDNICFLFCIVNFEFSICNEYIYSLYFYVDKLLLYGICSGISVQLLLCKFCKNWWYIG